MRWSALVALIAPAVLSGQVAGPGTTPLSAVRPFGATAGSPDEATMLALNLLTGAVPHASIRPFSRSERQTLIDAAAGFGLSGADAAQTLIAPLTTSTWINANRALPDLDGPVWQGKGITFALSGGVAIDRGRISAALRPLMFATQNLSYTPDAPREIGGSDFRDPVWGSVIDMPYRFGDRTYWRLDPGESHLMLHGRAGAVGVATGSEWWGPTHFYPLLVGAEAGGYQRVVLETASLPVGIGRLKTRYTVGRAESSGFDELAPGQRSRLVPALLASFTPRGFPTLELGGGRLFHVRWRRQELSVSTAILPLSGLLKASNSTSETVARDLNQLAAAFFRIAPHGTGVEIYGEYLREDHNIDLRDLMVEPDHASAYTIGLRRARSTGTGIRTFTMEVANSRISHLGLVRSTGALHTHGTVGEGHTLRGQPLASSVVPGGGGIIAAFHSTGATRSWFAQGEVRHTVQVRDVVHTGARGGVMGVSVGATRTRPRGGSQSGRIRLEQGFDIENGLRLQLALSDTRLVP